MRIQNNYSDRNDLRKTLDTWVQENPTPGRRNAELVILNAFDDNRSTIDLTGFGLTSLPNCFDHFPTLFMLEVSHNNFNSLPRSLAKLDNLRMLTINVKSSEHQEALMKRFSSLHFLNHKQVRDYPDQALMKEIRAFKGFRG